MAWIISASVLCITIASLHATTYNPNRPRQTTNGLLGSAPPSRPSRAVKGKTDKEDLQPLLPKMTHLEKMYNFCDLSSVRTLANSYNQDFLTLDLKTKLACGRIRCNGRNEICCPTSGHLNGTASIDFFCLNNNEEHRGECPIRTIHVTHLDYRLVMSMGADTRMPVLCRRDADCEIHKKCCLGEQKWYVAGPHDPNGWEPTHRKEVKCFEAVRASDNTEDVVKMGWTTPEEQEVAYQLAKFLKSNGGKDPFSWLK